MVEEKIRFRKYLTDIATLISSFLEKNIKEADSNIKNGDFQTFEIIVKEINALLNRLLGYTTIITLEEKSLIESCRNDILMFYDQIIERYYQNFKIGLPNGIFESNIKNTAHAIIDVDEHQLVINEQFGFYEYKLVLFEMLALYKATFERVFRDNQNYDTSAEWAPIILSDSPSNEKTDYKPIYDREKVVIFYYFLLKENIIEDMKEVDAFLRCFDFKIKPVQKPKSPRGKLQLFVYALSLMPQMNKEIAANNFGVNLYTQLKGKNYLTRVDRNDPPVLSFSPKNKLLASKIKKAVEGMINVT